MIPAWQAPQKKKTEQLVAILWKEKRKAEGAQSIYNVKQSVMVQREAYYEDAFQTEMQKMRLHIKEHVYPHLACPQNHRGRYRHRGPGLALHAVVAGRPGMEASPMDRQGRPAHIRG